VVITHYHKWLLSELFADYLHYIQHIGYGYGYDLEDIINSSFCLTGPFFSKDYSRLGQVPHSCLKEEPSCIAGASSLQAGCPSCHPTNSVKALDG